MPDDVELAMHRRAKPTFGLFAEAEASATLDDGPGARTVCRVTMPGASQSAREAIAPHLNALQARVLAAIVSYQPCTRDTLCEVLGMNPSTLRPRVWELLAMKRVHVTGYTPSPRRELLGVRP